MAYVSFIKFKSKKMTTNAMKKKDLKKIISTSKTAITNTALVFKESLSEFQDMGCFLPSSPWVGDGLVEILKPTDKPKRIIEAGAGVGPITLKIMDKMTSKDTLVVNELNPKFLNQLKDRIKTHKRYEELKSSISFLEGPIQNLEIPQEKFDYVICSLPFMNFSKELTQSIFEKLFSITSNDALMTYYEFVLIRNVSKKVSPIKRKERVREMSDYIEEVNKERRINKKIVWLNVMPINVYTLKLHPKSI